MPTTDDASIAIADVYASALLELSEARGASDTILSELTELAASFRQEPDVANFFSSPTVDEAVRSRAVEKMFRGRLHDLLVDALQVLNSKGRAALVPALRERFRLALEERRGEVDVYVTTSVPLPDPLRERLTQVIGARTGKKPQLIEQVDASLLGGLVVRVGDEKLDISIARRLASLRQSLRERASREIHSAASQNADGQN